MRALPPLQPGPVPRCYRLSLPSRLLPCTRRGTRAPLLRSAPMGAVGGGVWTSGSVGWGGTGCPDTQVRGSLVWAGGSRHPDPWVSVFGGVPAPRPSIPHPYRCCPPIYPTFPPPPAPPSAPRSVVARLNGSGVRLEWSSPRDGGGRPDLTYAVGCRACPERAPCGPCARLTFSPGTAGLRGRGVTVTGLRPYVTYTFTVTARNGVSHLSPHPPPGEEVNVTTTKDGKRRRGGRGHGPSKPALGLPEPTLSSQACPGTPRPVLEPPNSP